MGGSFSPAATHASTYHIRHIIPCGIGHRPVACVRDWKEGVGVKEVAPLMKAAFGEVFGVELRAVGEEEEEDVGR